MRDIFKPARSPILTNIDHTIERAQQKMAREDFDLLKDTIFKQEEAHSKFIEFSVKLLSAKPRAAFYVSINGLAGSKNVVEGNQFTIPWSRLRDDPILQFVLTDEDGVSEEVTFDLTKRHAELHLRAIQGVRFETSIRLI